ncbi:hypothetical protein [Clostridium felsineum]|uniref:Uncharacterized protein n=1 Tax=Clostridium felsineum TaxID=36839 RepID=A0A1S8LF71_9CLOT|nr:hypothetical protein [Clostridium felsineum]URZ07404.1 hypothetical protein CLROS_027420 [Clostridium felsineum]URZ12435.1 hypothetical protein CROST_031570 [Clostridium felsineum]
MKKILLSILFIILLCGCSNKVEEKQAKTTNIDSKTTKEVRIIAYPFNETGHVTEEVITKKEDVKSTINFINSIKRIRIPKRNEKGWGISVTTYGKVKHQICFAGDDFLNIDENWYKVDNSEFKRFKDFISKFNYEKKPFSDTTPKAPVVEYKINKG